MTRNDLRLRILLSCALLAGCDATSDRAADAPPRADTSAAPAVADSGSAPTPPADPTVAAFVARVDSDVFTRWGACPFECCVYRDWVAEAPVLVRAEPDARAAIRTTVPAGQRFDADTGFVRITSPQLVIVTAPVEAWRELAGTRQAGQVTLEPGDTLLVLEHLGEGHVMLSTGTDLVSAEQFWPAADGWKPYGGPKGRTVGEHAAEWWAHVRTTDGVEGWIDAYASELGNVDACGV